MKNFFYFIFLSFLIISCKNETEPLVIVKPEKINLGYPFSWQLSSVPYTNAEASDTGLSAGYNRAWLSWFDIDTAFYGPLRPTYLTTDMLSHHFYRKIEASEIEAPSQSEKLEILNLVFYPYERGPYNYDVEKNERSEGILSNGMLAAPETRWGGIQRNIFMNTEVFQYLDFWLMDPFIEFPGLEGNLYFNLGEISEDILPDKKLKSEAKSRPDSSIWCWHKSIGDYGLDGLTNQEETIYFGSFISKIENLYLAGNLSKYATQRILSDPSSDMFFHYADPGFDSLNADLLFRYKFFNGTEGNAVRLSGANRPDTEDFNGNDSLDTQNRYNEYKISIRKQDFTEGNNFIDKTKQSQVQMPNGSLAPVVWYHFKIPLSAKTGRVGTFHESEPVKNVRIYLNGFSQIAVLRMANIQLKN